MPAKGLVPRSDDQRGVSLVQVLVGVAITSVIAAAMATLFSQGQGADKELRLRFELTSVARHIAGAVDCQKSFVPDKTCPKTGPIKLLGRKDNIVISADPSQPTKFGEYTVKAECNSDNTGLVVVAARLATGGKLSSTVSGNPDHFKPNPLTGKKADWYDKHTLLFPENVNVCPNGGGAAFDSGWFFVSSAGSTHDEAKAHGLGRQPTNIVVWGAGNDITSGKNAPSSRIMVATSRDSHNPEGITADETNIYVTIRTGWDIAQRMVAGKGWVCLSQPANTANCRQGWYRILAY